MCQLNFWDLKFTLVILNFKSIMENVRSREFAAKGVFRQQIYFDKLTFFPLRAIKVGLLVFRQRQVLFEQFFKCKPYLKNSIKLIKKIKFAAARLKNFLVTRFSRNKSIFLFFSFGLSINSFTAQKVKFSIKDFFNKCDQIRRRLRIWSHLLKKSLMETTFLCSVLDATERFET